MKITSARSSISSGSTVARGPPTTFSAFMVLTRSRISRIRWPCTFMPVRQIISARSRRSKSISSTFSSMTVTSCSFGTRAAKSARQETGRFARLPSSPMHFSMPQKDTPKRGLTITISAIEGAPACCASTCSPAANADAAGQLHAISTICVVGGGSSTGAGGSQCQATKKAAGLALRRIVYAANRMALKRTST